MAEKWFPGKSWQNMAKKVAIDMLMIGPVMLLTFFTINEGLQGNGISGIKARIEQDYINVIVKSLTLWTPMQCINFYLIPLL